MVNPDKPFISDSASSFGILYCLWSLVIFVISVDSVVRVGFNGEDGWLDKFVLSTNREIEKDIVSGGIEEIA